jgi:methylated-DNA-[protein]-cysteine S-methyltransferase
MSIKLEYITFKTRIGWMGILASEKGLLATTLPKSSEKEALKEIGSAVEQAARAPRRFADLTERLKAYFSGKRVEFTDVLDLSGVMPFQQQVWQQTRLIPYGGTRSYLWVAEQIKRPKAARAVGQALGSNPLPIIVPCHRVVASDGRLGGFSGGLEMKRRLLVMESNASPFLKGD